MSLAVLVRRMSEAGAPMEAIALAIEEIEALQAVVDGRRMADRDRKRSQREAQKSANVLGRSVDSSGTNAEIPAPFAPPKVFPEPLTNTPLISPTPASPSGDAVPVTAENDDDLKPEHVIESWNDMAGRIGLSKAKMTPERRKKLNTFIRRHPVEDIATAIQLVPESPFLRGEGRGGWKANFDFLLQPSSFTKILERSYD